MTDLVVALVCSLLGEESRNARVMLTWFAPRPSAAATPVTTRRKSPPTPAVSPAVRAAQARAQARTRAAIGTAAIAAHARRSARSRGAVAGVVTAMRRTMTPPPPMGTTSVVSLCADTLEDLLLMRPRFTLDASPALRVCVWGTPRFAVGESAMRPDELRMISALVVVARDWGAEKNGNMICANERVNDALDCTLVRREALLLSAARALLAACTDTATRAVCRRVLIAALSVTACRPAVLRAGYAGACRDLATTL